MAAGYGKHISLISPKQGDLYKIGDPINIAFQKPYGIGNVNIYYRLNPKSAWILIVSNYDDTTYIWDTTDFNPSRYYQIKVTEYPDLIYEAISGYFIIYKGSLVSIDYPYLLHGYGRPAYEIYDNLGNLQYEYEFPYPLATIERWIPEIIVHKMFNGKKKIVAKGWWYECDLDFTNYAKKDLILGIQPILDFSSKYLTEQRKIRLYPRGKVFETGGNINYFYDVELSDDMEFIMQHLFRQGYQNLKIKFQGVERLLRPFDNITNLKTQEMNKQLPYGLEGGYGDQYGEDYG